MRDALAGQKAAFRARFGRDMGPDDPVFFDPDADEPVPLTEQQLTAALDSIAEQAAAAGLDPAYIHAWQEVGYIVTEGTRHLFSAAEVDAYLDAVARCQDDGSPVDVFDGLDLDEEATPAAVVADELRTVVDEIIAGRDPEPAWRLIDALDSSGNEQAADEVSQIGFGVLLSWLTGAREALGARRAVGRRQPRCGPRPSRPLVVAGLLHHPEAPDVTMDEVLER